MRALAALIAVGFTVVLIELCRQLATGSYPNGI